MKKTFNHEVKSFTDFKPADYFISFMIFIIVGIVPLIVHYAKVKVNADERLYVRDLENVVDMFVYWKTIVFLIAVGLLVLFYLYVFFVDKKRFDLIGKLHNPVVIAAVVYAVMVVLSSLFSQYTQTALLGVYERYESLFVLLGYIVTFLVVYGYVKSSFQSRIVLYCIVFSTCIIGILGTFQFMGFDPFLTTFVKKLVLGNNGGNYNAVFTQVYSTLYNPNCVGLYAALMLPITIITAIYYDKNKVFKYLLFFASFLMLMSFIGSRSTGGLVGVFADLAVVIITVAVIFIKSKYSIPSKYIAIFCGVCAILIASIVLVPSIRDNLTLMTNKILRSTEIGNNNYYKDMLFDANKAVLRSEYGDITFVFDKSASSLSVLDKYGEKVPIIGTEQNGDAIITSYSLEGFGDFQIQSQSNVFVFMPVGSGFLFVIDNDGTILPVTAMMNVVDPEEEIQSIGFKNMENWGSGRGYIWSRTFPLLIESLFIGYGPDCFVYRFPQKDLIGKIRTFGNPYIIVDKPHNLYLQTIVNTGMISLLAILFIFAFYIISTFISLISSKNEERYIFGLRLGLLTGICGYLTAALATDSVASVAPVFWAVLGLGFALNSYVMKAQQKHK